MNLLIGFVILLCLACSEIHAAEAAPDLWTRILFVGLVSLSVPGLALFQTLVVSRRLRDSQMQYKQREDLLKRLSVCHSAVWLTASLAIIWAVRWQDVVRGNWELNQWPLLDEALILAPVVFSLVASWAIFYEMQDSIRQSESSQSFQEQEKKQTRLGYVSLRFRVYFLMALVPITIAVLARDVSPWIESLAVWQRFTMYGAGGLTMLAGFPFLLLLMWKNQAIEDLELKAAMDDTCKANRLYVNDIRVWKTDGQIINALVAGMLPKFRVILLSDALVKHFPRNELLAVIRHEAGHVRLFHLPTRVGLAVLPLLALAIDEGNPNGIIHQVDLMLESCGLPPGVGLFALLASYVVYLVFGLSWISHKMEFEADIYACQNHGPNLESDKILNAFLKSNVVEIDRSLSQDMADALLRLAAFAPEQIEKPTLMHPSIGDRMRMIRVIESTPGEAKAFSRSFTRRRRLLFALLIGLCLAAISIY